MFYFCTRAQDTKQNSTLDLSVYSRLGQSSRGGYSVVPHLSHAEEKGPGLPEVWSLLLSERLRDVHSYKYKGQIPGLCGRSQGLCDFISVCSQRILPLNSSRPGRVFSDQGRHTQSSTIIFGDKHTEVQEGNWKFQAVCCLVPFIAIISSMVARLALHSLASKIL